MGYTITGRYKELIVSAGGENIAPLPIETNIKSLHSGIANVMMVGDKRKYNVALITLKNGSTGELPGVDKLDDSVFENLKDTTAKNKELFPTISSLNKADDSNPIIKSIIDAIQKTNANEIVCMNNTFKIQKFTILPLDFSVETEQLTPSLKLKRSFVQKMEQKIINKMYKKTS